MPLLSRRIRSPSRPRVLLALIGGFLPGLAGAAELVLTDLDLGLETMPTTFRYSVDDNGHTGEGRSTFDLGLGVGMRGAYALSAPGESSAYFIGAGFEGEANRYAAGGDYEVASLRLLGGYAHAFDDQWQIEVQPWLGVGAARFTIAGDGLFPTIVTTGYEEDAGLSIGGTYALARHWLIGAHAGYSVSRASLRGDGLRITVIPSGPVIFFGLVYRFGGLPPPIR